MPSKIPERSVGPIIGAFLIVAVLIAAALYVFASHLNEQNSADQVVIPAVSGSDDIRSLHQDLNNQPSSVD